MNLLPAGFSRDVVKSRYALLTPNAFVSAAPAGWTDSSVNVVVSPGLGANFSQTIVTLKKTSHGESSTGNNVLFAYVIEGRCSAKIGGKQRTLSTGHYIFIPLRSEYGFAGSDDTTARVLLFEKRLAVATAGANLSGPTAVFGDAARIEVTAPYGNSAVLRQTLIEDNPLGDMAVNIVTYQPGATTPSVQSTMMEQGILMLSGTGIFRLESDWHPVQAGDVVWIGPHCPHWFAAVGDTPASYIYYRDLSRTAL